MALRINSIFLDECEFKQELKNYNQKAHQYSLAITDISRSDIADCGDKKRMIFGVNFDLMNKIEKPCMKITCSYLAIYDADEEKDFDVLKDYIVVSHIIPYLRELAASLTMRSFFPVLTIAPVNTKELVDAWKKETKETKTLPGTEPDAAEKKAAE